MLSRIIRNSFALTVWLAVLAACFCFNVLIALSNYLGCRVSFELLGYERLRLGSDDLAGRFFGAFFSEATICHLFALTLTIATAFGSFLIFHLAFGIYDLIRDRAAYIRNGDAESASVALQLIVRDLILMAAIAAPVVFAVRWDVWLFRYRSFAGALGIEDPAIATHTIKSWEPQFQEYGDYFAWFMVKVGSWGYFAITAIGAIGIEFASKKTGDCWAKLSNAYGDWWNARSGAPEIAGGNNGTTSGGNSFAPSQNPGNSSTSTAEEELHTVLSDRGMDPVTPSYAAAHPELYWIDPDSGEIWDADYRRRGLDDNE